MTLYVAEHDEHHALSEILHEQKVEIQATLLKEVVVIIINIQKYQQLSQPKGLPPPWDPWLALRPDPTKGLSASGLVETTAAFTNNLNH